MADFEESLPVHTEPPVTFPADFEEWWAEYEGCAVDVMTPSDKLMAMAGWLAGQGAIL